MRDDRNPRIVVSHVRMVIDKYIGWLSLIPKQGQFSCNVSGQPQKQMPDFKDYKFKRALVF